MSEKRIGIIGLGKMGLLHMGIFNNLKDCTIVSVAEQNKIILSALKKYIPSLEVYKDYQKMLDTESLDITVITTPVYLHKEMILNCMNHGTHIFVEKPLCMNAEQTKEILKQDFSKKSMVGYVRRFYGTYNFAKKIINQEELGKILDVTSHMYVSEVLSKGSGWKFQPEYSGGGVLIDLGSHAFDLFHYLFGDITQVQGFAKSLYTSVEDVASVNIKFKGGFIGQFQVSWSKRGYRLPEFKIHIQCEKGDIEVTEKYISIFSEVDAKSLKKGKTVLYQQQLGTEIPINIGGSDFTREDHHFVNSIIENKSTISSFEEAAKTNVVIDKIYSSIKNNRVEHVDYEVV